MVPESTRPRTATPQQANAQGWGLLARTASYRIQCFTNKLSLMQSHIKKKKPTS